MCTGLSLQKSLAQDVWEVIASRYGEEQRFYHTMEHINALLSQASLNEALIVDKSAVYLAIFFHDIVYDPKSKTNEEDSAELFLHLLSHHLDSNLCEKIKAYIIATKKHDVAHSEDTDLKLFIDMDMSILGASPTEYEAYARQIRSEYEFVPEADYCKGRAAVLESFVASSSPDIASESAEPSTAQRAPVKYIFASELYRNELEDQARRNLAWECEILKLGRLV